MGTGINHLVGNEGKIMWNGVGVPMCGEMIITSSHQKEKNGLQLCFTMRSVQGTLTQSQRLCHLCPTHLFFLFDLQRPLVRPSVRSSAPKI